MSKKIKIKKNGPYYVTGGVPLFEQEIVIDENGDSLSWTKEKKIPTEDNYLLCRCGRSKNMPFCDNSHLTNGFDGTESAEVEGFETRAVSYSGPNYTLRDDESLCASARFCDRAGTVWGLVEESDAKSEEILKDEVCNCPSGRLVLEDKNENALEPELEQSISITSDPASKGPGPIWVKGGIEIESADGEVYEKRNRVTLCRCGKSGNKPFCDSSHMIS